jgi:hypothetical protein
MIVWVSSDTILTILKYTYKWIYVMLPVGQWTIISMDETVYNAQLKVGESVGDNKQKDLVYYFAIQPRHS